MAKSVGIAVTGASGRMGSAIIRLIEAAAKRGEALTVAARLDHDNLNKIFEIAGKADVIIDFSQPEGTVYCAKEAAKMGIPLVVGTTGLSGGHMDVLKDASTRIPVLWSSNTSLGVQVLISIVNRVAEKLGAGFDIDVVEAHHRHKKDAPSGTAKSLGDAILGRDVRYHSLRSGGIVGEHSVRFASEYEVVELRHQAMNRDVFAQGAIKAALWISGRPPGLYSMQNVLGLE